MPRRSNSRRGSSRKGPQTLFTVCGLFEPDRDSKSTLIFKGFVDPEQIQDALDSASKLTEHEDGKVNVMIGEPKDRSSRADAWLGFAAVTYDEDDDKKQDRSRNRSSSRGRSSRRDQEDEPEEKTDERENDEQEGETESWD